MSRTVTVVLRLLALVLLVLAGSCARQTGMGVTSLKPANLEELREYLLAHPADLDQFRLRGPFAVTVQKDRELRLSTVEAVAADVYLSPRPEKAPLVVFLHGYDSAKEDHASQALHVATWGMHALALQLPNTGPWIGNGRTLAELVALIHRRPEMVDARIDVNRIVLVGHSFGGSAVAVAMAEGAPVAGGILLDPAGIGRGLPAFLARINRPVMLLGADEQVSMTRNRDFFYRYIRRGITEVTIKDASHEDAQYPVGGPPPVEEGEEPLVTEELQITFASALTAAAFGLAWTGKLDYAWSSYGEAMRQGTIIHAKRK